MEMVKNLKYLRNQKGISQQKLAIEIGISQQSINKYENHKVEPDIATLISIAQYFNTSVDYLIGNTEISRIIESVEKFDLNSTEANLVTNFRLLNDKEKQSIFMIIDNYLNR